MDELEALAAELRKRLPPVPSSLIESQRQRVLSDPRASVRASRRVSSVVAFSLASTAVLAVACAVWLLPSFGAPARQEVPLLLDGERAEARHTLGDGSVIRLEEGARGELRDSDRDGVSFELQRGRGTFDVTPGPARVFRVKAGRYDVRVLGTSFSVAYEPPEAVAVTVARGVVSVSEPGREPVRLAAGDRFVASKGAWRIERASAALEGSRLAPEPRLEPAPVASSASKVAPAARSSATQSGSTWHELYQRRDYPGALAAARLAGVPRLTEALNAKELADLADVARLGGDLPAALMVLRALERRFPSSPPARDAGFLMGRVLAQSGRAAEAITTFERYLAANPEGVYSLETMGRLMELYSPRGERARAQAMAARYLQRAPSGPYQRLARSLMTSR